MPLIKSATDQARTANALEMQKAGHERSQSWAAAYRMQRDMRAKRQAEGGSIKAPSALVERRNPGW